MDGPAMWCCVIIRLWGRSLNMLSRYWRERVPAMGLFPRTGARNFPCCRYVLHDLDILGAIIHLVPSNQCDG